MILRIRPFLILLLVLLQFAAPLLHAHKNNIVNFGASIHLPEFEQVNKLLKHSPELIAPTNHDEEIVAISMGMKNDISVFSQDDTSIFILLLSLFLMAKVQRKQPCFAFQTELIPNSYFFNLASPRAPPIFYAC